MRPDLLARLRATMRGEIMPEAGVTGVTGVTDVTGYASKSPELRRLRRLRVKNTGLEKDAFSGVTEGVTSPPPGGGLAASPLYDPEALQVEADRRNAAAIRDRITDRWCACGHLATFAWPGDDGREVWICAECLPTGGRA